jgi:hypothetical protein
MKFIFHQLIAVNSTITHRHTLLNKCRQYDSTVTAFGGGENEHP